MRWTGTSAGIESTRAFGAMVLGDGAKFQSAAAAVRASYERGVTDEFVEPATIVDSRNEPIGSIRDDDSVVMYNYRADRAREITLALTDQSLAQPSRSLVPKNLTYTMMTRYEKNFPLLFSFCHRSTRTIFLADVMERASWKICEWRKPRSTRT